MQPIGTEGQEEITCARRARHNFRPGCLCHLSNTMFSVESMTRSIAQEINSFPTTEQIPVLTINDKHYDCAGCGEKNEFKHNLKLCTGCRFVKYCSRECQLSHRKKHKSFCKREKMLIDDKGVSQVEILGPSYWKTKGCGDFYAFGLMPMFQRSMILKSNELFDPRGSREIALGNAKDGSKVCQIPHDVKMMHLWNRLAYALKNNSYPEKQIKLFAIWHVDLPKEILEILLPILETLPIKRLSFSGNDMGNAGIKILTKIIRTNMTIEEFDCEWNRPDDIDINRALFAAVEAHPNLELYKTCSLSRTFNPGTDKEKE